MRFMYLYTTSTSTTELKWVVALKHHSAIFINKPTRNSLSNPSHVYLCLGSPQKDITAVKPDFREMQSRQ